MLLQHLKTIKKTVDVPEVTSNLFIKITKDTDDQDASTQASDTNDSEDEQQTNIISFSQSLIDLTLNANGKADLYFHAYIWFILIETLYSKANSGSLEGFD